MIHDGGTWFAAALLDSEGLDPRTALRSFGYDAPLLDDTADDAEPVAAEINHGVWIARCDCGRPGLPAPGGVVWISFPYLWCPRCGNEALGGRWRPVVFPAEREQIEAVLDWRPDPRTRNWAPGETVEDLVRDNLEHGVPAPLAEVR